MTTDHTTQGAIEHGSHQDTPAGGCLMRFPDMPPPVVHHPVVGELFDRIQMQQYAVSFATMNRLLT